MSNQTRRNRLLASCAAAAIATLAAHAPVRAQGFQFTGTPTTNGATVTAPNADTTRVEITAPSGRAIVNWEASNNNFLPTGKVAEFVNSQATAGSSYTILNRIKPADPSSRVELNGLVRSTLTTNTSESAPGGNIWFYSPSGLLVGSGARINVGSLLLSSLDVLDENFLAGGTIRFGRDAEGNPLSTTNAGAEVQIANGAQINALGQSAYVALIAPRVVQSGAISVAGSAHYVAAEAVDMTINGSLFDIAVQVGTGVDGERTADAALVHDGTTSLQGENGYGGPSPAAGRSAVLVAVPKNDAVTMLVQGSIAYEPATGAAVFGNRIILSGGRNVFNGEIETGGRPGNPNGVANVRIDNKQVDANVFARTSFGGEVDANATGAITVAARNTFPENGYGTAPPDIDFAAMVTLEAQRGVDVAALGRIGEESRGGSIRIGGDLRLISDVNSAVVNPGNVRLSTGELAAIDIIGDARLSADLRGTNGVDAISTRIAEIVAAGGRISIGGSADVGADASGGFGGEGGGAPDARGGTARIVAGGGAIEIGDFATVTARGSGGFGGGSGTGGTASIDASAGSITIGEGASVIANGSGESGYGLSGGAGTGGTARVATTGTGTITLGDDGAESFNTIAAKGFGGFGSSGDGGAGQGGTALLSAGGGAISTTRTMELLATARGGNAFNTDSLGGAAAGGTARVETDGGDFTPGANLRLDASAQGGAGATVGGDATGGTAILEALDGTIAADDGVELRAEAVAGGGSGQGGAAQGGTAIVRANGPDAVIEFGAEETIIVSTNAGDREVDFESSPPADGGKATGGNSRIEALVGSKIMFGSASTINVEAIGRGQAGTQSGGTGTGGVASMLSAGGDIDLNGNLNLSARGFGGISFESDTGYGDGIGGTASLGVTTIGGLTGSLLGGGNIILLADGRGGEVDSQQSGRSAVQTLAAGNPGGAGRGGTASVLVEGELEVGSLTLDASGVGGNGGESGYGTAATQGSEGRGGIASVTFRSGAAEIDSLSLIAIGDGGHGGADFEGSGGAGGAGGAGIGGIAAVTVAGTTPAIDFLQTAIQGRGGSGGAGASGGGNGGAGGLGMGGTLALTVSDDGTLLIPVQTYSASGFGGEGGFGGFDGGTGGDGGEGIGSGVAITVTNATFGAPSDVGYGTVFAARGEGGPGGRGRDFGGEGGGNAGDGGQGGSATGGTIAFTGINAKLDFGGIELDAGSDGGFGGAGGVAFEGTGANGGGGGAATGGTAILKLSDDGTGSVSANSGIAVTARAAGGRGGTGGYGDLGGLAGDGGEAEGGNVRFELAGTLALTAAITGDVNASGGDGGDGFDIGYGAQAAAGGAGGSGTGGAITLIVASGNVRLAPNIQLGAFGNGGRGGGSENRDGGAGGKGNGGAINVAVTGGELSAPSLRLRADGFGANGGAGGDDVRGGNGGRGGDAEGGTITVHTAGDGRLITNSGSGRGLDAHADARAGSGGDGGDGSAIGDTGGRGGDAGNALGGNVSFAVAGGEMDLGNIKVTANGWGGGFATGGSGAGQTAVLDDPETPEDESRPEIAVTLAGDGDDGRGAGGTIGLRVADSESAQAGRLLAGQVSLRATGRFGEGGNDAAGLISLVRTAAAPGGAFRIGSLEAKTLGVGGARINGFELDSSAGAIEVLGSASIITDKAAVMRASSSGTLAVGGTLDLQIGGNLALAQAPDASQNLAGADLININAASVTGATAALIAVRDIRVQSPGAVSFGRLDAGDDILINAFAVSIGEAVTRGNDDEEELDGSNIFVTATDSIEILVGASAADDLDLEASLGDVSNTDPLGTGLRAGGRIDVIAGTDVAIASAFAGNDIEIDALLGSVTSTGLLEAGDDIVARSSSGSVTVANALTTGLGEDVGDETGYGAGPGDGSNIRLSGQGLVRLDNGQAVDLVSLTSSGDKVTSAGLIKANDLSIASSGDIALNDLDIANGIGLAAGSGSITGGDFISGRSITLTASRDVAVATLVAGTDIDARGASITIAGATAGRDLDLTSAGATAVQRAQAGDDVTILAGTTALVGAVSTTGAGSDSESNGFGISIEAAGDVSFGSAAAIGDLRLVSREGRLLRLEAPTMPGASLIDAGGSLFVSAADDLNLNSVKAGADISLRSGGAIAAGSLTAPGALSLVAVEALSADVVRAGSLLAMAASIDFADVELAGTLDLATPGTLLLGSAKAASIFGSASQVRAGSLSSSGQIGLKAASGDVLVETATAGGSIDLVAAAGAVTGNMLTADGAIGLFAGTGDATLGTAVAGTDITVAGAKVALADVTAGRDIVVQATGDAVIGSAKAGDDFTATAGGSFAGQSVITTGEGPDGDESRDGRLAQAGPDGSNIRVSSVGALALEVGTAKSAISLSSSNGAVGSAKTLTAGTSILANASGAITLVDATAGQDVELAAGTNVAGANLAAGDDLRLQARNGGVTLSTASAGDDIDVTATAITTIARATTTGRASDDGANGASIFVTSPGGVAIARIDSAGGAVLRAVSGTVTISEDLRSVRPVEASGRAVSLRSLGALGVRSAVATAGDVALTSAGNLSLENADASGSVVTASAAMLGISGTIGAAQIELSSRDIAIGSSARIGSAGRTGTIQITANGTSATAPAVVGGAGQGSNYRLDNAEFARLAAQNIAVSVGGETAALQVDTLTVRQPSVTRSLTLSSSGDVAMIGRLTYENAGTDNAVRVSAARAFTANAPAAGIVVANAQGALTGSIDVDARSIVVASQQAQADLATTSNIAARDDRLGRNDSETDNAGFLRAGAIRLAASERIFVQNSGLTSDENDDRAGLSAGAGGITLVTKGTSPVEIIVNGRQDDGNGGFIVGAALIEELTITGQGGGPASFAPGSTVNGCLIGGANCLGLPLDFGVSVEPLLSELTEEEDEDEEDGAFAGPASVGFGQLITVEGGPILPVIDDPVTGAGNDDLSTGVGPLVDIDNSQRDRDEQVDAPVTGTGNEALQGGTALPDEGDSRPNGQPTIDDPVTGAGNDDLQDGSNR